MKIYLLISLLIFSVIGNIYFIYNGLNKGEATQVNQVSSDTSVFSNDSGTEFYNDKRVTTELELELINDLNELNNELDEIYSGIAEEKIDEALGLGDQINEEAIAQLTEQQRERIVDNSIRQEEAFDNLEAERVDINNRASLNNLRALGEIYYSNNGSYSGVCDDSKIVDAGPDEFECRALPSSYVMYTSTVSAENKNYICVDSEGFSDYIDSDPLDYSCV